MIKVQIVYDRAKRGNEVPHYVSILVKGHAQVGESVDSNENHEVAYRLCAGISLACEGVYQFASLYDTARAEVGKGLFFFNATNASEDPDTRILDARIDTLVWILSLAYRQWPNHFSSFAMIERKNKHGSKD